MKATKAANSEFSNFVPPSFEHMKEIKKEMSKINKSDSGRILYNIKPNRKVQQFNPVRIINKAELMKA